MSGKLGEGVRWQAQPDGQAEAGRRGQQRELGAAGELEDLEVLYTEDMERIREKDLLDKEALLKQLLAARRRAMQQACPPSSRGGDPQPRQRHPSLPGRYGPRWGGPNERVRRAAICSQLPCEGS